MAISTNQKWFGGLLLGGIVAYIAYSKFSTPAVVVPTTPVSGSNTTAFTGRQFYADGCGGCKDKTNFTGYEYADGSGSLSCAKIMSQLSTVRDQLQNNKTLTPSEATSYRNTEMNLLSILQQMNCA